MAGFFVKKWLNKAVFYWPSGRFSGYGVVVPQVFKEPEDSPRIGKMTKKTQKNTKIIVIALLINLILAAHVSTAKASILDWFSDPIVNASNTTFGFISPGFSFDDQLTSGDQAKSGLPLIQGQSVVSSNSPALKSSANLKNAGIKALETIIFASAYSSTPDQTDSDPFTTAWGTHVRDGIVAANFLPFGTKIKIPEVFGNKVFVVEDRMNSRYWRKIDIWFPDRASALEFGLKKVKIQILES